MGGIVSVVNRWSDGRIQTDYVHTHSQKWLFKTAPLFQGDEAGFAEALTRCRGVNGCGETLSSIKPDQYGLIVIDWPSQTLINLSDLRLGALSLMEAANDCVLYQEALTTPQNPLTACAQDEDDGDASDDIGFVTLARNAENEPWIYSGDRALTFIGDAETIIQRLSAYEGYRTLVDNYAPELRGDLHIRLHSPYFTQKIPADSAEALQWLEDLDYPLSAHDRLCIQNDCPSRRSSCEKN